MSRRLSKRKITTIVTLVAAVIGVVGQQLGWFDSLGQQAVQNQPGLYTVERFVDGDTIAVNMGDTTESIRMIGIDTPETHKPNTPVQCYGPAAAAYTKNLIGTGKIRLEADAKSQNRDRYNRLLRYVYLTDGRLVEKELIKNGYGFAYTQFPFSKSDEFVAAETEAKHADRGLWGNCTVTVQTNGRKQTNNQ